MCVPSAYSCITMPPHPEKAAHARTHFVPISRCVLPDRPLTKTASVPLNHRFHVMPFIPNVRNPALCFHHIVWSPFVQTRPERLWERISMRFGASRPMASPTVQGISDRSYSHDSRPSLPTIRPNHNYCYQPAMPKPTDYPSNSTFRAYPPPPTQDHAITLSIDCPLTFKNAQSPCWRLAAAF
jgi:hypothetical protein